MIQTNRLFEREEPSREAKSIYIFAEGVRREYQYFTYFIEMDSRINIKIYELDPHEDNSPRGLLGIAENCIIKSEDNPNPKYIFQENDEVWIVLDTDIDELETRKSQIVEVREKCSQMPNWFVTESNPCFEVWLYYHLSAEKPNFNEIEKSAAWKVFVNDFIEGGFDSRKHPVYIENASKSAENNYEINDGLLVLQVQKYFDWLIVLSH